MSVIKEKVRKGAEPADVLSEGFLPGLLLLESGCYCSCILLMLLFLTFAFIYAGIKGRIEGIEIFRIQLILYDAEGFAEALEMHDFPCPQEFNGFIDIRVVFDQPEDVVVGDPGLLFRSQILRQIGDWVAGGLEGGGREGDAGGSLGPEAQGVIYIIGVEAGFL